jgi:hypothetical protein
MQIRIMYLYTSKKEEQKLIEDLYKELKEIGAVQNMSDFSREWLGKEKSYYRVLLSKRRVPSADAISFCASRLRSISIPDDTLQKKHFIRLSDLCIRALLEKYDERCRIG